MPWGYKSAATRSDREAVLDWLEISVEADEEAVEAVVELFNRYGRGQAVIETPVDCFEYELDGAALPGPIVVKTYLPLDGTSEQPRRRLEEGLWHLRQIYPLPEPQFRRLAEADWAEAWKQQYHRQRVGQRIVIVPLWEEYEAQADEVVIRLEPGMAFGTGLHPTTRLCLAALESSLAAGSSVLDVGTGTGVLAVAAARLGAGSVLALDADPVAVAVAQENVQRNGVQGRVTVRHGSLPGGDAVRRHVAWDAPLDLLQEGRFDLVVVNILAPVISDMSAALADRLATGGQLIASGLIDSQEEEVRTSLRAAGLTVAGRRQEKDWVALLARQE